MLSHLHESSPGITIFSAKAGADFILFFLEQIYILEIQTFFLCLFFCSFFGASSWSSKRRSCRWKSRTRAGLNISTSPSRQANPAFLFFCVFIVFFYWAMAYAFSARLPTECRSFWSGEGPSRLPSHWCGERMGSASCGHPGKRTPAQDRVWEVRTMQ